MKKVRNRMNGCFIILVLLVLVIPVEAQKAGDKSGAAGPKTTPSGPTILPSAPPAAAAAVKPDLILKQVSVSKEKAAPGENVEIRATLENTGLVELSQVTIRIFSKPGTFRKDLSIKIPGRGTQDIRAVFQIGQPGVYELLVWVDPDNRIEESNKQNNLVGRRIEILPPPAPQGKGTAAVVPPLKSPAPPPVAKSLLSPTVGPGSGPGHGEKPTSPQERLEGKEEPLGKPQGSGGYVVEKDKPQTPRLPYDPSDIRLTYFAINFDAAQTTEDQVTLNYRYTGSPNYFEASESPDFRGRSLGGPNNMHNMPFKLSYGAGTKTVYFRAGYATPTEIKYFNVLSDSIEYRPPPPRMEYNIPAGEFYDWTTRYSGIKSSVIPLGFMSNCNIYSNGNFLWVTAVAGRDVGSSCDFILFDGTLKEGWQFKSHTQRAECSPPKRDYSVDEKPSEGSGTPRFKLHLWADPPGNLFGEPSFTECKFYLDTITLTGPSSPTWRFAIP